ncbi:MAG: aminomethyltransferase beta-barrel domain-containing protein, partial [Candidatus Hydrogenedentota bacterium]
AQIRYNHHPAPATAHVTPQGLEIVFDEPERAVAPGQWAVLYDEEGVVLAAGLIERGISVAEEISAPAGG